MSGFTHNGLQEDLAKHLRVNTDRMVWTDTQLGPAGSPRPDVFTIHKSYSRFRSDCYEIKVSMSDLRSDITSGKWQKYMKYGSCCWFAFERGLAPLDLIPKECGVILRSDKGWRAARKPVAQALGTLPHDAWMKLLIESNPEQHVVDRYRASRSYSVWHADKLVRERFGTEIADLFRSVLYGEDRLKERKKNLHLEEKVIDDRLEARRARAAEQERSWSSVLSSELQDIGVMLGMKRGEFGTRDLAQRLGEFRGALHGHDIARCIRSLQALTGELEALRKGELC